MLTLRSPQDECSINFVFDINVTTLLNRLLIYIVLYEDNWVVPNTGNVGVSREETLNSAHSCVGELDVTGELNL